MKKFFVMALLLNCLSVFGQKELNLVPMPVEVKMAKGNLVMPKSVRMMESPGKLANKMSFNANYLVKKLKEKNITVFVVSDAVLDGIYPLMVVLNTTQDNSDKYELNISKTKITISGNEKNIFYGIQTLIQLLESSNTKHQTPNKNLTLPQLTITDYPRFQYRGMHLDVGRHFFPVSFVKKYIDYLAAYKFNTFHWHLTEDQGWRIEIKKYPNLTKTGAYRNGTIIGHYPGKGNDGLKYGGFYTQEEIKEVVKYAADRYITVIPEIEMPGHSLAALASYPFLGCTKGPYKPAETWGVFDDVYCAGNDSTFTFLQGVLDEVLQLFPSKYIHIGGDECPKERWKSCTDCQARIKKENLKDEHELQSYFIQRMEKYLNSKGRKIIGWDEILEGGLAPNATVMSWRGEEGGIEAAKQNHDVIMTPGGWCYFDHSQSKNEDSLTIGGYTSLEKVYGYEPIPASLSAEQAKHVLGAQGNVWTEYMKNPSKVEYMIFPRLMALSEVLWTPKEKRNWKDFERRLPYLFDRLEKQKINYSKAYYDLKATVLPIGNKEGVIWQLEKRKDIFTPIIVSGNFKLSTHHNIEGFDSLGNKTIIKAGETITHKTRYKENIVNHEVISSGEYTAMIPGPDRYDYEGVFNEKKPKSIIKQIFHFNKATGKKINLVNQPHKSYPGDGAFTLVNGIQNEQGLGRSSEFIGFLGADCEGTIDFGKQVQVSKIRFHVLSDNGAWIYEPQYVSINYGNEVTGQKKITEATPLNGKKGNVIYEIKLEKETSLSSLNFKIANFGTIPSGINGAGTPAWLFVDEIEIE